MHRWNGWGDDTIQYPLSPRALTFLRETVAPANLPSSTNIAPAAIAPGTAPAKHLGGPQRVLVVEHVAQAPPARRSFAVGLAYSLKADPRTVAWTMDMAPSSGRSPAGIRLIPFSPKATWEPSGEKWGAEIRWET